MIRPPWIRLVTSWYSDLVDPPAGVPGSDVLLMLSSVYAITEAKVQDNTPKTPKQSRDPHRQESGTPQLFRVTDVIPEQSSAYPVSSLLVVVNSCLSSEDWAILCPIVWRLAGELKKDKKAVRLYTYLMCVPTLKYLSDDVPAHEVRGESADSASKHNHLRHVEVGPLSEHR